MERPAKKKLKLPTVLAVVLLGGSISLSSCGNDGNPSPATCSDAAPIDCAPDGPPV